MGGVVEAVVNVVTSFIGWLIPTPDIPDFETPEEEKGVLINKQSNNAQIPIVYGRRQVGITRVFLESSGTDNTYLYMAGVVCEGEIEEIEEIYIDDKQVTFDGALTDGTVREVDSSDSNFYKDSSHIQIQAFYGTDNQVASSILTNSTNWTSNHRLRGVCYLAFRFKWNQDIFSSIPQVRVTLKGRKVYDPRTATTAYTSNSALILLDYLRNTRYGKGLPDSAFESDFASFKTSANECETQITPYTGADQINLFETNAVIDTDQKVIENVKKLLNPMRSLFTYNNGVYKLKIEGTGTAVKTITADHVVGGAKVLGERKNNKYNRVLGTFVNPDKNWQNDTVSFPPADDSIVATEFKHATMLAQDNGTLLEGNFQFPNVTNKFGAEALCEVILRRSRNQLQIQLTLTSEFLELEIGDIVAITYPSGGFNAKPFRVLGLEINEDLTVNVQLFEHQDNFYTFNEKNPIATIADTILPNPNSVQPPASLTLDDTLIEYNDGTVIVALDVTIGASTDSFVDYYQVEYKKSTDSNYIIYAQGSGLNHRVLNVIDQDTYDVRVKAVNSLGVSSTYVTAQRTIVGAIAPPSDVEDFSCNIVGQEAHLSWNQIPDLDLAYYQLRFSEETDGTADWQNSVNLVSKVSRPATSISVPARAGTYLIKAVDKLGNFSSNATAIISNVTDTVNHNSIATQSEHPDFLGTLTNTVIADDSIRLDSSELFDSASGLFDDETTRFFDSGVSNADFFANGNYEFADVIDIGAKHTARITASLTQTSDNPDDLFDNRSGLFDSASSNFDGDTPANCDAHLEIATSDDNVTYTAFQNFVIGNYTARYFKFRVFLTSRDLASTPVVSAVTVTIDMPDRIFSGNDITSGAGTYTVTFTNPFKSVNYAVGITGEDLATGDFFVVENKTINGFDLTFKNSGGTAISRTFDYIAKGF
jgi:hypothetical protein